MWMNVTLNITSVPDQEAFLVDATTVTPSGHRRIEAKGPSPRSGIDKKTNKATDPAATSDVDPTMRSTNGAAQTPPRQLTLAPTHLRDVGPRVKRPGVVRRGLPPRPRPPPPPPRPAGLGGPA